MDAQIIGVAQELSFLDGSTDNYMVLQLPNGQAIRASIDAEAAMTLTALFIKNGGAAAQQAIVEAEKAEAPVQVAARSPHPALAQASPKRGVRADPRRNYTPLSIDNDGSGEFGGNYQPGMDDDLGMGPTEEEQELAQTELAAIDNELQSAAALISGVLGDDPANMDPAAMRRAVEALQTTAPLSTLPKPQWTAQPTPRAAQQQAQPLTVGADARGYPVFSGSNVADVRDLIGGNTDGQEPGEVGSA